MHLNEYVGGLRRYWFTVAACALLGILAAFTFIRFSVLDQASASVAVLDPLTTRTSGYGEAQVTFDTVIKSNALAAQVGAVVNEDPGRVHDNLSVTLGTSLSALNPSPLYIVHGRDSGVARAILLVNTAVDLGRKMYVALNAADGSQLRTAIEVEAKDAANSLATAQKALDDFGAANDAVNLPARLDAATTAAANQTGGAQAASRAERQRLEKLAGQYNLLKVAVDAAQARVNQVAVQEETLVVGQLLPTETEIKQVDGASEESQGLYKLLIYTLGLIAGVIVGLALVYTLLRTRLRPATPGEVAEAFGAPVLVRIPRAAP